ncbi:MAG: L28 family ribosomal protein [Chloroflexota bacterium]|jgi:ribosomal protein L28
MARSCAMCGKTPMRGFNPQSSGMNRVRAKRRYNVNLQQLKIHDGGRVSRTLICTRCRRTLMKSAS